jgi:methanogenic corrinoid protein MtbC1
VNAPYKIGSLSRLTGYTAALLRAWERRYGLLTPDRGAGGQRLYSEDDLQLLLYVRRLLEAGRSIGEVAGAGRDALLARAGVETHPGADRASQSGAPAASSLESWRRQLIAAALALDSRAGASALDDVFALLAPERAVDDIIVPVAHEVGDLWAAGKFSVASEHLLSDLFLYRIRRLLDAAQPASASAPIVVAACFPDEQHQLGLAITAWRVARHGFRVAYLGPSVPLDDLIRGWDVSLPAAVILSVTRCATFDAHRDVVIERCAGRPGGPLVFVGGQGIPASFGSSTGYGRVLFARDVPIVDVIARIQAAVPRPFVEAP